MSTLPVLFGSALISPNPGLIIWTLITFVILLAILKKFAWGPILGMVEEREKGIREALDAAGKQREEAQRMIEEHQAALEKARKESADMVRKTQEEVEKARTEAIEKARAEAEDMIATARRQIEAEQKKAFVEVRQAAVDLAIAAASRLVEVTMDEAKQRKLVEDYLKELEKRPAA